MLKLRHEEIPRPDPSDASLLRKHPISVVVDNVRSIYNVGSIFRTSDAAGIQHIYLTGITGTPDNAALHKTALGAQDTVPWSHENSALETARRLKNQGCTIGVLEITDEPTPTTGVTAGHFPLCLIVGNELHGVDPAVVELADLALEIPQFGVKQSMNVSVAYGVAAFDLVRRYRDIAGLGPYPEWDDARFQNAPANGKDFASINGGRGV